MGTKAQAEPAGYCAHAAVTGVGSAAAYIDDVTISQSLFARVKSYRVGVTASGFTPDVLEAALQPWWSR